MYLYGASGHAKVIIDILKSMHIPILGMIDDNKSINQFMGYDVYNDALGLSPIIISIGNNVIRKKIANSLCCEFGIAISDAATVSSSAIIGSGSVVMPGAIIQADVKIGKHCIINTGATIDHECIIEDFVHISPNATLCGNVVIEEGTHIGANSVIIQGTKIGRNTTIGAGTVVIEDIPDDVVAVGNPARIIKNN